jgi:hypothetical protein
LYHKETHKNMANESSRKHIRSEQEDKLIEFYDEIIRDTAKYDAQKRLMMQLLNTKISQIDPETKKKKWIHYILRIGIMILSAISTIVLGLKNKGLSPIQCLIENASDIALILSSIITFMSALAAFWDIETYWIRLKIMLNKLKKLRHEYAFRLQRNSYMSNEDMENFFMRFTSYQSDEYWENYFDSLDKK